MIFKSTRFMKRYFLVLTIALIPAGLFFDIKQYGFIVIAYSILTFIPFGANHFLTFFEFSELLQKNDPTVFKSNSIGSKWAGSERISNLVLFQDKESLNKIKDKEFQYYYSITKLSLKFTFLSFFIIMSFSILKTIV